MNAKKRFAAYFASQLRLTWWIDKYDADAIVVFKDRQAHDQCAVFSRAKLSIGDLPLFETAGGIYDDSQIE